MTDKERQRHSGEEARGKERVKEIKRKDCALQVSSEASSSVVTERSAATERDINLHARLACCVSWEMRRQHGTHCGD